MSIPGNADAGWRLVFENLRDISVDELVEEFGMTPRQVQAVLQFAAHSTEAVAPVKISASMPGASYDRDSRIRLEYTERVNLGREP